MGIISSFFGERPAAPQTGGFTQGAQIPEELAPYYKDILGKAQALYDARTAEGYQPYQGPTLAQFTPEQEQAFTGIAGLQGTTAPVFEEAMGLTREAAAPITTEQVEEYMNPYQQAVVDIEKREAQKQYESQVVPQLAARAATTGGFGGSRQAILEGMAADTQQRLLGDIQAKGSAQAYQDAINRLQMERQAQGAAAGQLASMAPAQLKTQLGEIGAQQTVGEERQKLTQQALNEAYGQYLKEQEFPYQTMGRYQSVVTGAPIAQTQYIPPAPPPPSMANQLIGGLGTLGATYGAFGGFSPGGLFGMNNPPRTAKTGGGIADLPVIKRQSPAIILDEKELEKLRYGGKNILQKSQDFITNIMDKYAPSAEEIAEAGDVYSAQNTANILPQIGEKVLQKTGWDIYGRLGKDYLRGAKDLATYPYRLIESALKIPGIETAATRRGDIENMAAIDPPAPEGSEVTDEGITTVLKQMNVNPKEDIETDLTSVNKSVKELQEESDRLTKEQQEKKDKKDPDKTDKPDIYKEANEAEASLLEALGKRSGRLEKRLADTSDREREAQFGNLALFFQRLSQKPTLVAGAIESAGEVLPTALKTRKEFTKDRLALEDSIEDVKLDKLKTDVDIKKAKAKIKSATNQRIFENAIKEKELGIKEHEAITKRMKELYPDLDKPSSLSKVKLDLISEDIQTYLYDGDADKIAKQSPRLYKLLTNDLNLNKGEAPLTHNQVNNFVDSIKDDQFMQKQVFERVDLARRVARAEGNEQTFDAAAATRKAIIDVITAYPYTLYDASWSDAVF